VIFWDLSPVGEHYRHVGSRLQGGELEDEQTEMRAGRAAQRQRGWEMMKEGMGRSP